MEYEKLTNPEHYKSHAVTVEPIFWCETPMLQKAAKEPSALQFFKRLFNSCVDRLCSLGLSQDEIWEKHQIQRGCLPTAFRRQQMARL